MLACLTRRRSGKPRPASSCSSPAVCRIPLVPPRRRRRFRPSKSSSRNAPSFPVTTTSGRDTSLDIVRSSTSSPRSVSGCGGGSIRSNPSVTSERSIARCDRDRAGTPRVRSGEAGEAGKTPGGGSRAARRRARPAAATMGVSGPGWRRDHDARHRDRGGRRRRRWATAAQWAAGQQGGRGR